MVPVECSVDDLGREQPETVVQPGEQVGGENEFRCKPAARPFQFEHIYHLDEVDEYVAPVMYAKYNESDAKLCISKGEINQRNRNNMVRHHLYVIFSACLKPPARRSSVHPDGKLCQIEGDKFGR